MWLAKGPSISTQPPTHLHTQAHTQVNVCNQRNNGKQENKCTHVPHRCATYIYTYFSCAFSLAVMRLKTLPTPTVQLQKCFLHRAQEQDLVYFMLKSFDFQLVFIFLSCRCCYLLKLLLLLLSFSIRCRVYCAFFFLCGKFNDMYKVFISIYSELLFCYCETPSERM